MFIVAVWRALFRSGVVVVMCFGGKPVFDTLPEMGTALHRLTIHNRNHLHGKMAVESKTSNFLFTESEILTSPCTVRADCTKPGNNLHAEVRDSPIIYLHRNTAI
jgi:hypothetical protein